MADKPLLSQQVMYRDKRLNQLLSYYKAASKQLVDTMNSATEFNIARRREILNQIDEILGELDEKTQKWVQKEVEDFYKKYNLEGVEVLKKEGFPVKGAFTRIDREAVKSLADGLMTYYEEAYSGVKRAAMRMLNEASRKEVQQLLAAGKITGEARREISDRIAGQLKEGFVALIDRGGRRWSLEAYSNMLTRTTLVRSANEGMSNRLRREGFDLVQVSNHSGACPLCTPYEGEIFSLSGKHPDYPPVDDAKAGGLFHPNCRHRLLPYHEKLAEKATIWNPDKQQYIRFRKTPKRLKAKPKTKGSDE